MPGTIDTASERHDVLVVGGGPGGAAAAYWLATRRPRRRVRRAQGVPAREDLRRRPDAAGRAPARRDGPREAHRRRRPPPLRRPAGLRPRHHPRAAVARAPGVPVARLRRAPPRPRPAGRRPRRRGRGHAAPGHRGRRPRSSRAGWCGARWSRTRRAASAAEIRARYVVVADGANSRFGRALGAQRNRTYPQGMAIRGYYESPLHAEPWIESALDVRDRNGNSLPGYGWIFPVGDGTINVGIGLLSTFRDWKSVNTSHLMDEFAHTAPEYWGISPDTRHRRAHRRPPADGRVGHPERRADLGARRRRRRHDQPVQRRGHRLRLRDRPDGRRPHRRGARHGRRHGPAALPGACSRTSTASTSRWPGSSPR